MTEAEFRNLKQALQTAKPERHQPTPTDSPTLVYRDSLLRVTVVVAHGGQLWLCPRRPGGWASRQRLTMTTEAREQRLTPARDVEPGWLGIPAENDCVGLRLATAPRERKKNHPQLTASLIDDTSNRTTDKSRKETRHGQEETGT
jgi:hypothetical protein